MKKQKECIYDTLFFVDITVVLKKFKTGQSVSEWDIPARKNGARILS